MILGCLFRINKENISLNSLYVIPSKYVVSIDFFIANNESFFLYKLQH